GAANLHDHAAMGRSRRWRGGVRAFGPDSQLMSISMHNRTLLQRAGRSQRSGTRPELRVRSAGVTLIELMVALAVGSFLLIGAVTVFVQSQQSFRVNESVARLQEAARFVFDAIEPDLRMAHYWGLTSRSERIQVPATPP